MESESDVKALVDQVDDPVGQTELERHLGKPGDKITQTGRDPRALTETRGRGHPQYPTGIIVVCLHGARGLSELSQRIDGTGMKRAAVFGQGNRSCGST